MINTRLILIEGLPGAGKTTTSIQLGTRLKQQGLACQWYLEKDKPHPIACLQFKLKDLAHKLPPLWRDFTTQALQDPTITIIESRLWQNTALFMFMSEYPVSEILQLHQLVWKELTPLDPILVYLQQDDTERALHRLASIRNKNWLQRALETTSKYPWFQARGRHDFAGWVALFQEWQLVAEDLYQDWPFRKTKIPNPHADWEFANQQLYRFLGID